MSRRITRALFELVVLLLLLITGLSGSSAEDRALIIGINRYPHLSERLQLTGSVNDARMMVRVANEVWRFSPENIKLLVDQEATSGNILAAIETWLIQGTRPGDRVLLTYSGHGYFLHNFRGDEPTGFDQTLAPHDVWRTGVTYANMITDDEIGRMLERLKGRETMLIVDSCHSGTITRALDPDARRGPSIVRSLAGGGMTRNLGEPAFERLRRTRSFAAEHPHVMAWTAVASTELAEEDMSLSDEGRHGVFTRALVEGLLERRADANRNGTITPFELIHFLRRRAADYCNRHRCRTRMTPTLEWPATFSAVNLLDWHASASAPIRPDSSATPQHASPAAVAPTRPTLSPQDMLPHHNSADLRLELLPNHRIKLGEEIKLRVTSPQAGYLIVLDAREDGRVTQLFPSKCARKDRLVRAGAPMTLPDATYGCVFQASDPGRGNILAIIAKDSIPIDGLLARHRDLEVVSEGEEYLAVIARHLMKVWTGDARDRPVHWAMAAAPYEVTK